MWKGRDPSSLLGTHARMHARMHSPSTYARTPRIPMLATLAAMLPALFIPCKSHPPSSYPPSLATKLPMTLTRGCRAGLLQVCHNLPPYLGRPAPRWASCEPCPPPGRPTRWAVARAMAETDR